MQLQPFMKLLRYLAWLIYAFFAPRVIFPDPYDRAIIGLTLLIVFQLTLAAMLVGLDQLLPIGAGFYVFAGLSCVIFVFLYYGIKEKRVRLIRRGMKRYPGKAFIHRVILAVYYLLVVGAFLQTWLRKN